MTNKIKFYGFFELDRKPDRNVKKRMNILFKNTPFNLKLKGKTLIWEQINYVYDHIGWLEYLINHILLGYCLNGEVEWSSLDDLDDYGSIIIENNVIILERKHILSLQR
jgi:hypothetical protein